MCRSIKSFGEFPAIASLRLGTTGEITAGVAKGLERSAGGRTLLVKEGVVAAAALSGLLELCGAGCAGTLTLAGCVPNAVSRRSNKSDSRRPFEGNTRYPDFEAFGSSCHAVILALTRTRDSVAFSEST